MVDIIIQMEPIPSPTPPDSSGIYQLNPDGSLAVEDSSEAHNEDAEEGSKPWLTPPPRAKTRLLSRSRSFSDVSGEDKLNIQLEPLRRNSSGEYNQPYAILSPISSLSKHQENPPSRNSITTKSSNSLSESLGTCASVNHLSPINNVSHQKWKPTKSVPAQEDRFAMLLQTTAERVLNRIKSRQLDLGKSTQTGRKTRRQLHGIHHHIPRKLQPIHREDGKTPHLEFITDDSKTGSENAHHQGS